MEVCCELEDHLTPVSIGDLFYYDNEFFILHCLPIGKYALLSLSGNRAYLWSEDLDMIIGTIQNKKKEVEIIHFPKKNYYFKMAKR